MMMCDRWEKNLEMLKSGALGDTDSPETLLRYWQMQAEAGYPQASENVKYYEDMVRRETEAHWGECRKPLGDYRYCETAENDYCSYGERREG